MILFGLHTCIAALNNPKRKIIKIYLGNPDLMNHIPPALQPKVLCVDKKTLQEKVSAEDVHQGIIVEANPLEEVSLQVFDCPQKTQQCLLILDQVTDPRNIGAIIRSAGVFEVDGIILTHRHTPKDSGVLAKTASGALERVPLCFVNNLSQAIDLLKTFGFWIIGFSEKGANRFDTIDLKGKIALIMGAEGKGMRPLTQKKCDFLAHLPTSKNFSTLNVSNASAIALYEVFKHQGNTPLNLPEFEKILE